MVQPKLGGWSTFRQPTESDRMALEAALSRINLIPVEPQLVAEQVVAGQNYLFMCTAKNADCSFAIAVYAKPGGEAEVDVKTVGEVFAMFEPK